MNLSYKVRGEDIRLNPLNNLKWKNTKDNKDE